MARHHRMAPFPMRHDHGGAEADLCLQILSVREARDTVQFSFHSFLEPRKGLTPKLDS